MWSADPMAQRSLLASVQRHDPVTGEWRTSAGHISTARRFGSPLQLLATCKLAEAELRGRASALELRPNSVCV